MKTTLCLAFLCLFCTCVRAQNTLSGRVLDEQGAAVAFANVALYTSADSQLVKVEITGDDGSFRLQNLAASTYDLVVTFLGAPDLRHDHLQLDRSTDLGTLQLAPAAVDLVGAIVTATRALVEVKPDRTIFNVQGTINAAGNDALALLRMAPGVTLDNNDNISVLSRAGVIIYVDGRRLPLTGTDLTNYLRNLIAEQIDRIDIISSPGAKYEAEGNAGIIDIRLKKAENEGTNGTLAASGSQGRYAVYSLNASGNYRNRRLNLFGNLGYTANDSYTKSIFTSRQNQFLLFDRQYSQPQLRTPAARVGLDLYLGKRSTLGTLYSGQFQSSVRDVQNKTVIHSDSFGSTIPEDPPPCSQADSILIGGVDGRGDHTQNTFNLNYNYAIAAGHNLNVDLDYGRFRNDDVLDQPNRYETPDGRLLRTADAYFDTPIDIDIYTGRLDYDFPLGPGAASAGAKYTRVKTDNTFLAYDGLSPVRDFRADRSNQFTYDETVYAAYLTYAGSFGERLSYSAGLRLEATRADSRLLELENNAVTTPIDSSYLSLFPNAGLTYQLDENHTLSLRYGRRINRPDYNVLNPFRVQLNELSYEAGNPTLGPEIVNNLQLGYTIAGRYNFQLAYSRTEAAIARLFSPDRINPAAGFATYDNLNQRTVYSLSASAPVELTPWWSVYFSGAASYVSNQANFPEEFGRPAPVVDVKQFNYSGLLQNTFTLPWDLTAELTGRYISAGISEGIFEYDALGYVNVGLQRSFLAGQLNVKLSGNDLFRNFVINGGSNFDGLLFRGSILRDSRRVALSVSYNFGNQKVSSRRRDTGLDEPAGRVR
ncbi:TonB-dependent receptor domain-containing protein [Neolewinella sp.]|uniref:TonB-dependent receptor domain-containing protein n=1 Tax=Neolewinella sp. TaxID=2993543 RepID=UPI003B528198